MMNNYAEEQRNIRTIHCPYDVTLESERRDMFSKHFFQPKNQVNENVLKKLARVGFFPVSQTSRVKCYSCFVEYDLDTDNLSILKYLTDEGGEEEEEDPVNFHRNLTPNNNNCMMMVDNLFSRSKPLKSLDSYFYEQERLDSFIDWPLPWLNPKDLAKDGFYYLRKDDKVVCAFCNASVSNWNFNDDIRTVHIESCPFEPEGKKCDAMCGLDYFFGFQENRNIPISLSNEMKNISGNKKKYFIPERRWGEFIFDHQIPKVEQYEISFKGGIYPTQPIREDMSDYHQRLNSFDLNSWPIDRVAQTPEQFAEAGFFYVSSQWKDIWGDLVFCYHCLGGLKNWNLDDDPLTEHAKYFPNCSRVLMEYYNNGNNKNVKNKLNPSPPLVISNIQDVVKRYKNEKRIYTSDIKRSFNYTRQNALYPDIISSIEMNVNNSENIINNNNNNEKNNCIICMNKQSEVMFYNCQHMCTCIECFKIMFERTNYTNIQLHCPRCNLEIFYFSIPYCV